MDSKEEAGWPMIRHVAESFFFLPFFVTHVQVVSLLSIRSFEVSI